MKSWNVDYLLDDEEFIKNSIITCCKSKLKKKRKNSGKYFLAKRILNNLDKYTAIIKKILKNKEYIPAKVRSFEYTEKYSKKVRTITTVPLFPDQVIHQIIVNAIKPILTRSFYEHSYASIPGKGTHKAKKYIEKSIRKRPRNFKYICKMDIEKCYKNISHNLLKDKFRKLLRGNELYNLICQTIDHYYDFKFQDDELGIPIGFSTSQWFCNFTLTEFDYYAKQTLGAKEYDRYMDDVMIADSNKRILHQIKNKLIEFLSKKKLKVKSNYQLFRFTYIPRNPEYDKNGKPKIRGKFLDFLGFKFYRFKTLIRKHIFISIIKQAKKIVERKSNVTFKVASSYISRFSYVKHTNSFEMFNKYLKGVDIKRLKGVISNESRKYAITCC